MDTSAHLRACLQCIHHWQTVLFRGPVFSSKESPIEFIEEVGLETQFASQ